MKLLSVSCVIFLESCYISLYFVVTCPHIQYTVLSRSKMNRLVALLRRYWLHTLLDILSNQAWGFLH